MLRYIGSRLLQLIPILIGVSFLSFAVMQLAAGDVVDAMSENTGEVLTEEEADARRAELGLDGLFLVQYGSWLKGVVTGDMGVSYVSGEPVFQTFLSKLGATAELMVSSVLFTILLSVPLGILSAVYHNRLIDYLIRFLSFIGNSLPNFFVSLLLIYFFSVKWKLLPVLGTGGDLQSLILPTLTLGIAMTAKYLRQVRAAVLEELKKDYVQGARARGVRERVILFSSVLRTAMVTIVPLLALSVGSLLGGTAVVESVFMWDGVGKLAVDSINMRDYPMIQAYVVWMAVIYVLINLVSELICQFLDPRIRLWEGGADRCRKRR